MLLPLQRLRFRVFELIGMTTEAKNITVTATLKSIFLRLQVIFLNTSDTQLSSLRKLSTLHTSTLISITVQPGQLSVCAQIFLYQSKGTFELLYLLLSARIRPPISKLLQLKKFLVQRVKVSWRNTDMVTTEYWTENCLDNNAAANKENICS